LDEKVVKPNYIRKLELDGLMARRDKIVAFFDKEIAAKGEAAVLFDSPRSGQPCGVRIPRDADQRSELMSITIPK
jgi:hypothetical protein